VGSPLIKDHEKRLRLPGFELNWIELGFEAFWGNFSRRGTHVKPLKIGSRGAVFCFGGI
jgi:hypothetical protein